MVGYSLVHFTYKVIFLFTIVHYKTWGLSCNEAMSGLFAHTELLVVQLLYTFLLCEIAMVYFWLGRTYVCQPVFPANVLYSLGTRGQMYKNSHSLQYSLFSLRHSYHCSSGSVLYPANYAVWYSFLDSELRPGEVLQYKSLATPYVYCNYLSEEYSYNISNSLINSQAKYKNTHALPWTFPNTSNLTDLSAMFSVTMTF